jgi:hypothetical protein
MICVTQQQQQQQQQQERERERDDIRGIAKSMIIVVPPANAALVPVSKSSFDTVPMKGISM